MLELDTGETSASVSGIMDLPYDESRVVSKVELSNDVWLSALDYVSAATSH